MSPSRPGTTGGLTADRTVAVTDVKNHRITLKIDESGSFNDLLQFVAGDEVVRAGKVERRAAVTAGDAVCEFTDTRSERFHIGERVVFSQITVTNGALEAKSAEDQSHGIVMTCAAAKGSVAWRICDLDEVLGSIATVELDE